MQGILPISSPTLPGPASSVGAEETEDAVAVCIKFLSHGQSAALEEAQPLISQLARESRRIAAGQDIRDSVRASADGRVIWLG